MSRDIILASSSPRRREQLERIGLEFRIVKSDYQEDMEKRGNPEKIAQEFALGKAQDVANKEQRGLIIAGDVFVMIGRKKLGKPKTIKNAREMLTMISGKTLHIVSALAIVDADEEQALTDAVVSKVKIKTLEQQEIDSYVATEEPLDKAGAFAIQEKGMFMVESMEGDYQSVVGLPMHMLIMHLRKFGVTIF